MHALVHAADIQDRDGGVLVMATLFGLYPFLLKLYADGGYQGPGFQKGLQKRDRQGERRRSSSDPITPRASSSCPSAGSSSAPSLGSADAAGWPRTGSASMPRRLPSSKLASIRLMIRRNM